MSSSVGSMGFRSELVSWSRSHEFSSSPWTWWESHGRTTTLRCSCCRTRWSWPGGTGGWCPTTHQGRTLAAMEELCFNLASNSWPSISGVSVTHWALVQFKFTSGALQFLQHWMDGLFGNGAKWGGDVIVLLASAERLAARWCKGARQGLLSALDNKRGCAILLPNTRRRRRNKVVTWQLSTVGCFYYQSCSKRSKLHLLAFLRWNIMSACGRGEWQVTGSSLWIKHAFSFVCLCANSAFTVRDSCMYLISKCVVCRSCAIKQDLGNCSLFHWLRVHLTFQPFLYWL